MAIRLGNLERNDIKSL